MAIAPVQEEAANETGDTREQCDGAYFDLLNDRRCGGKTDQIIRTDAVLGLSGTEHLNAAGLAQRIPQHEDLPMPQGEIGEQAGNAAPWAAGRGQGELNAGRICLRSADDGQGRGASAGLPFDGLRGELPQSGLVGEVRTQWREVSRGKAEVQGDAFAVAGDRSIAQAWIMSVCSSGDETDECGEPGFHESNGAKGKNTTIMYRRAVEMRAMDRPLNRRAVFLE